MELPMALSCAVGAANLVWHRPVWVLLGLTAHVSLRCSAASSILRSAPVLLVEVSFVVVAFMQYLHLGSRCSDGLCGPLGVLLVAGLPALVGDLAAQVASAQFNASPRVILRAELMAMAATAAGVLAFADLIIAAANAPCG